MFPQTKSITVACSTLVFCFAMSAITSSLHAQNFQARFGFGGANGMMDGTANATQTPDEMANLLRLRVDEMRVAADLNEKQVNRLTLIANVVAKKVFEEHNNPLLAPMGATRKRLDEDRDSFSDEDTESKDNRRSIERELAAFRIPVEFETALKHKTWKKAIGSVLNDEQERSWGDYVEARDKEVRKVAVQYKVLQLQEQLQLRKDQIQPVTEIVDRLVGDDLVEKLKSGQDDFMMMMPGDEPKEIGVDDLKDVLSDAQAELFEQKQSAREDPFGAMGFPGRANRGTPKSTLGVRLSSDVEMKVGSVTRGSMAHDLGIKAGDIIDSVNGQPVDTRLQLRRALQKPGGVKTVTVLRDGSEIELEKQSADQK